MRIWDEHQFIYDYSSWSGSEIKLCYILIWYELISVADSYLHTLFILRVKSILSVDWWRQLASSNFFLYILMSISNWILLRDALWFSQHPRKTAIYSWKRETEWWERSGLGGSILISKPRLNLVVNSFLKTNM